MLQVRKSRKPLFAHQVQKFIDEFEDLFYDGSKVVCNVCDKALICWTKWDCTRHVKSTQHQNKKQGVPVQTQFRCDLLLMLIACNVPLHILDKAAFRQFWHKYNPLYPLPSRKTLWDHIPTVRATMIEKITGALQNRRLWLCVDETTDRRKNSILNIVVRVLDPSKATSPLLLASKRLTKCTGKTITQVVVETLEQFQVSTSQIVMFMTDSAATMRAVGHFLSEHGCRMLHVTCKLHALHLVAETIRKCFPKVDSLIVSTKEVFLKSPKCLHEFHKNCPGIHEPPQPIFTRWGTWLKAAFYYAENFQQIKAVILQFNPAEAAAIKESQTQFLDFSVETDLKTISTNYRGVYDAIAKLQNSGLALAESLQIVNQVNSLLYTINDAKNEPIKQKFDSVLQKDPDFNRLIQICLSNSASKDPLSECKEYFTYASITSIDVERSFSQYKNIFSAQRTLLSEKNMQTYLMLLSFYRSFPINMDQ